MEFCEKLQELRKQKGLTQEELAQALFVSRTAISKWESGRGYPNIDSLKGISRFFGVTIDELLSGDQLLTIAEADTLQVKNHFTDLSFGLLDCSAALFFLLPFFGQRADGLVEAVSLSSLTQLPAYLKTAYFFAVLAITAMGILTLALQTCQLRFWRKYKYPLSFVLNALGALLFIISQQPYAAAFLFVIWVLKGIFLAKKQ